MAIDLLTFKTTQRPETMRLEALSKVSIAHTVRPKKFYREGTRYEIPDIGSFYIRWNRRWVEVDYNPNNLGTWSASLKLFQLLNIDIKQAIIVAIHFDINFPGVSPDLFRRELVVSRTRKLFIVRELIHMRDGAITERTYDWSHPTVNHGSLPFKQITFYDYFRKHKTGRNPTGRLEARYNSRSSLNRTVRLDELSDYALTIRPFQNVRFFKEAKTLPKRGQARIKFELFRRLRPETDHKGALQRLKEFDPKPARTFAKTLEQYRPRRIDLNRLYQKKMSLFLTSPTPRRVSLFLERFELHIKGKMRRFS